MLKLFIIIIATVVIGCMARPPARAAGSGFLGGPAEYEKMTQQKSFLQKAAYAWIKEGVDLTRYNKIYVEQLQVRPITEESRAHATSENVQKLQQLFYKAMSEQLNKDGLLAMTPNEPNTLILSACVTHIKLANIKRNAGLAGVGFFVPGASLLNSEGEVAAEMMLTDANTGERIATFMDNKTGETQGAKNFVKAKANEFGNIEGAFIAWAKDLNKALKTKK